MVVTDVIVSMCVPVVRQSACCRPPPARRGPPRLGPHGPHGPNCAHMGPWARWALWPHGPPGTVICVRGPRNNYRRRHAACHRRPPHTVSSPNNNLYIFLKFVFKCRCRTLWFPVFWVCFGPPAHAPKKHSFRTGLSLDLPSRLVPFRSSQSISLNVHFYFLDIPL